MYEFEYDSYVPLSFIEANIVIGSCFLSDFSRFILRLDTLLKNTKDPYLIEELESLLKKFQSLSQEEYEQLRTDAQTGTLLFPPNYQLKFLDPEIK